MVMIPLLTYHLAQMLVAAPIAGRLARGGHTSSF
jgi:predicted Na+-dependent transporter